MSVLFSQDIPFLFYPENVGQSDYKEMAFRMMMRYPVKVLSFYPEDWVRNTLSEGLGSSFPFILKSVPEGFLMEADDSRGLVFSTATVGQIVSRDIRLARAFIDHGIDFCCGGKSLVSEVCTIQMISLDSVVRGLVEIALAGEPDQGNIPSDNPVALIDYIVQTHHAYIRNQFPIIMSFLYKVSAVHGKSHPELIRMRTLVVELEEELLTHLDKEEQILFPMIRQIIQPDCKEESLCGIPVSSVEYPIHRMMEEHESAGRIMHELEEISNQFTVPPDGCNSYRFLFESLKDFFLDLQMHIHLENNVLFPHPILQSRLVASPK